MTGTAFLRAALMATSALVPVAGALLTAAPALATCTVTGGGSLGDLQSNGTATCVGTDTTNIQATSGKTNVTVTVGDG